ncbi:gnat family [Colletotrichum incanum]|uniref:Gnat family n=1 Tax=Colletotrichum incanum TaxID=1573173 RepID=A0A161X346_COLIC|nr:gnat family [Colletotrichum incanum]
MPTPSALILEPATVEDVPALTEVWFAAFAHDPEITGLWPDTLRVRAWWDGANRGDMLAPSSGRRPRQRGRPREGKDRGLGEVGHVHAGAAGRRYPPRCEDMPGEVCDAFFEKVENLDTLVTHPDYQRRGAGSMLLKWGCELAARRGSGRTWMRARLARGCMRGLDLWTRAKLMQAKLRLWRGGGAPDATAS